MNIPFLKKNGIKEFKLKQIKSDASFRKYFRIYTKNKSINLLLVRSPKKKENNLGYIKTANILEEMNLSVPKIIDYDNKKNLFLIEDFGSQTFKNSLKNGVDEYKLYNLAVETLIYIYKWKINLKKKLPLYSEKKLINEALLFLEWYWPFIYKKKPSQKTIDEFIKIWKFLLKKNLKSKKILVHRDFHIDNLFFLKNRVKLRSCGLIDFQDAVLGPSSYDLVSLLEDARRDVDNKIISKMYKKFTSNLKTKEKKFFVSEYRTLAINRHLKVIGIFSRLYLRDKKKNYLKHIPRLWRLIEKNLNYDDLKQINIWIDEYFPKKFRVKPKI